MEEIAEKIRTIVSKKEGIKPFTEPVLYEKDATTVIVRGALCSGDREALASLTRDRAIHLIRFGKQSAIYYKFEELNENGVPQFIRIGDERKQVTLSKRKIKKLEPVERLTDEEIEALGPRYGVPEKSEVEASTAKAFGSGLTEPSK